MPGVEELLDQIGNAQFVTTLDLAKGYWQVPVSEEDREKTGYPSSVTFQRMMDSVLRGTEAFAGVYLDDIAIYSRTWQDHLNHVRKVLQLRSLQAGRNPALRARGGGRKL